MRSVPSWLLGEPRLKLEPGTSPKYGAELTLESITPVLGGGVDPFVPDEVDVVRVPGIRGALRWWWRMLHPALDPKTLKKRELCLWGGVSGGEEKEGGTPSAVRISVQVGERGVVLPAGHHRLRPGSGPKALPNWDLGSDLGYALFPLQRPRSELAAWRPDADMPTRSYRSGLRFTLAVTLEPSQAVRERWAEAYPDEKGDRMDARWQEVLDTLSLWTTFGGIGARTRRGFGSLQVAAHKLGGGSWPNPWVVLERASNLSSKRRTDRPSLLGVEVLQGDAQRPDDAHRLLVRALREFRQREGIAREPGRENRPGRSWWPEADLLRLSAQQDAARVQARTTRAPWGREDASGHPPREEAKTAWKAKRLGAPRAAFGLPLNVTFITPGDTYANGMLVPVDPAWEPGQKADARLERWASPLLLCVVKEGNNAYHPVLLFLSGHVPDRVRVRNRDGSEAPVRSADGAVVPVKTRLVPDGDALRAFSDWLRQPPYRFNRRFPR